MKYADTIAVSLLMLGVAAMAPAVAEEASEERDMDAAHCVRINNIDNIEIIDDRTLLFKMRSGSSWLNELPRRCPGLKRNDTLMYRSSVGQLCNVDIITVLDNWGFGFSPGVSCGLGMFHPISDRSLEEMRESAE